MTAPARPASSPSHSRKVRAVLEHEGALALLAEGCTYAQLAAAIGRTVRTVKLTMADADRAGLVTRVRPVDATTGTPLEAVVTLRRRAGTSAA